MRPHLRRRHAAHDGVIDDHPVLRLAESVQAWATVSQKKTITCHPQVSWAQREPFFMMV